MTLIMHERIGFNGRRPSPFSWRIRYALAHKGVPVDFITTRFAEVDRIRGLSGQDKVPIIEDDGQVIHDSWNIAVHLEDRYPGHPSLFGGPIGRGLTRAWNIWSDTVLSQAIRPLIWADFIWCLDPGDRAYFRRSREAAVGRTLEDYCADRDDWMAAFQTAAAPLEQILSEQAFLAGEAPAYADYLVFSVFQYARLGSPHELLPQGSAIRRWRDAIVDMFGGLGNRYPGYPSDAEKGIGPS